MSGASIIGVDVGGTFTDLVMVGADGRVLKVHSGFNADDTAALESAIQQALSH